MIYVESIEKKLPLYLESFPTSVGINTTINLYRLGSDEAEIVRLEIYGLSYLNVESDPVKNPNVTAFRESYLKAIELLERSKHRPQEIDLHLWRQRVRPHHFSVMDRRAQTPPLVC